MKGIFAKTALVLAVSAALAGQAFAGRPFETAGTGTAPKGRFSLEVGAEYESGNVTSKTHEVVDTISYGLLDNMELSLGTSVTVYSKNGEDETSGLEDSGLGLKWRFYGGEQSTTAVALNIGIGMPTGDENEGLGSGHFESSGNLILSTKLPHDVTMMLNSAYHVISHENDTISLAAGIEIPVAEKLSLCTEYVTDQGIHGGKEDDSSRAAVGAVFKVAEKMAVDAALRFGLDSRTPDIEAVAGVTIDF